MRVLILAQFYPPEPAVLMHELARTLRDRDHDVGVLTGFPNYPTGRVYAGYRLRPWRRETLDGVPVTRVFLYPEHGRSGVKRALNYVSFALSSTCLAPFLVNRPDVLFVYHPPLTIGIPALALGWLWRVPYVYQIQDMWPETLVAIDAISSPRVLGWIGRFAKRVYARAAALCVISDGFRDNLLRKEVPAAKIHVISNWVDGEAYRPVPPDPVAAEALGMAGRFNVMFAGNIGEAQGLDTVLDAAELLRDVPEVQFVLVGDGLAAPRLRDAAATRGLMNVRFLGRHPVERMPDLYALADVLLIHLKDDPLFRITIPHKTFAYMASGKPVLAAAAGDCAAVVSKAGAGVVCAPEQPRALADAVRGLYALPPEDRQRMAENGRRAIQRGYSRELLVAHIEAVLKDVESRSRQRSATAVP